MASYYVWSAAAGSANGTSWANAYTTLTTAFTGKVAGDVFYVAHDHAQTTAAAITLQSPGTIANPAKVICVDRAGSVPPVSADRRTTAQIATTGASSHMRINGYTHYDGIVFICTDSTNSASIIAPDSGTAALRFDNCSLQLRGNAGTNRIYVSNQAAVAGTMVELNNTTLSFSNTSQNIDIAGIFRWRNTPLALIGSAVPTVVLTMPNTLRGATIECIGVDLSAAGSGKTIVDAGGVSFTSIKLVDCKLNASVTKSTAALNYGSGEVDFVRSSASGNFAVYRVRAGGTLEQETTIVRTGGASDGTTPIAWKIITTANCTYTIPLECPPIAIWNEVTGSAVTATVEGIWGGGAVPNDDDIWLDVEYLGDASSPLGSFVNDGKANLLATAAGQTTSSATWGGSTTKFKLNITFTAQQKGWIYARVKCGKASSTFYVDPLVTLT